MRLNNSSWVGFSFLVAVGCSGSARFADFFFSRTSDCNDEAHKYEVLVELYNLLTIGQSIIFVKVSTEFWSLAFQGVLTDPFSFPPLFSIETRHGRRNREKDDSRRSQSNVSSRQTGNRRPRCSDGIVPRREDQSPHYDKRHCPRNRCSSSQHGRELRLASRRQ